MRTSEVSTTLTLGRDARSRPTASPTARAGGTQPITKISRSRLGRANPRPYESLPRLAVSPERSGVHRCARRTSPRKDYLRS
eukprot:1847298-Prymnesium_polylepis.1